MAAALLPWPVPRRRLKMSRAATCSGFASTCGLAIEPGSATTVQANVSVSVSLLASVTVTVAVPEPVAVGVPETARVVSFMATPAGRPAAA